MYEPEFLRFMRLTCGEVFLRGEVERCEVALADFEHGEVDDDEEDEQAERHESGRAQTVCATTVLLIAVTAVLRALPCKTYRYLSICREV